ncbi:MAG: PEGA domain-containing protein [Candidatus Cloacimonetes bacterium]|nr:PEGA domain-containing protein [Candidatus Cloacimonadota bacterium]
MRRILILLLLVYAFILMGAEFKITGELQKDGFTYITDNVRDTDGVYCARLQVNSDIRNLQFDSNRKPVKIEREMGKYFVYLSPGEHSLTFLRDDYAAYEYEFPLTLEANTAYVMTVVRSGYGSADEGLVTITFELNEKDVYIAKDDNPPILNKQKSAQYRLTPGTYTFKFNKQGFKETSKQLQIEKDEYISINLEQGESGMTLKLPGIVIINSEPEGAEVYLNDQKMGVTTWQDELIAGDYKLTIKARMYHTKELEFSLAEGQTLELPVVELMPKFGYYSVKCDQSSAVIYLDGVRIGEGNISRQKIESGSHLLEAKLAYYHDHKEEFLINDGDTKDFDLAMKPAFGVLEIKSTPVSGADVYINNELVGTTPYTNERCLSGQYRIRVDKALYVSGEETAIVYDETLTQKAVLLTQDFGTLIVEAKDSDIYVNSNKVGSARYQANLQAGNYQIEARRERHKSDSKNIYLGTGTEERVILNPEPIMGSVSVMSNPPASKGAAIWVNGEKEKKTTPAVLPLLIGQYSIKLSHPDFLEQTKNVSLREGDQEKLVFELETYQGSMLASRNKWRRNGWLGFGSTVLAVGAGLFFNMQGDGYADDYAVAKNTEEVDAAWDDMESSYNLRDTSYYISVAPAVYTIYSWIKTGSYNHKLKIEN